MSGTPQKMLEHLLETRLDGRRGTSGVELTNLPLRRCELATTDLFLDDFLLTHIVFMPYPHLTKELLRQYPFNGRFGVDYQMGSYYYYFYLFIYLFYLFIYLFFCV